MRAWGEDRTVSAKTIRDIVRCHDVEPDPRGLRLRGVRVHGRLDLAFITSSVPVIINDCLLAEGINATEARLPVLDLEGCVLEHRDDDLPLAAGGLTTGTLSIRNATVTAATDAAVFLFGAELGELDCLGATITNENGVCLAGDDLRVRRKALLCAGFTATSEAGEAAVTFHSAEFGEIFCMQATMRGKTGPALSAGDVRVHRTLVLRDVTASGADSLGAINLSGAELGELDCANAVVANETGPAFAADDIRVHRDASFYRCTATSGGDTNVLSLMSAEIGELSCRDVTFTCDQGPAVWATDLRVHRDLSFRGSTMSGGGSVCVITLGNAAVGGDVVLSDLLVRHHTDQRRRWSLDGFTYSALPIGISPDHWLMQLREATPGYAAQPYQQLAAVHRAAGHDSQARRVLMAQRRDQLDRRALTGRAERAWVRLTGLTLGYGYQPWRALFGLLAVIGAAVVLAVVLGGQGGLAKAQDIPCTVVERVGVGLDLGTPLLNTRARCETTTSGAGQVLTVTGWLLRLLAWAFATLFIAGFTSAVRKN